MRLFTGKTIKRAIIFIIIMSLLPPIFGWAGRHFLIRKTEQLAHEINAKYSVQSEFGWLNSVVTTQIEFNPEVLASDNEWVHSLLGNTPIVLDLTHELNHGPILFSASPFAWLKPYFGPFFVNSAIVVEQNQNPNIAKIAGDYLTAKTYMVAPTVVASRIKPGRQQYSIDSITPVSILVPELVIEQSIFGGDNDAFFSIAKAQFHSNALSSPILDDITIRVRPLSRRITPDAPSNIILSAKQIRTERIFIKNIRINSLMQPVDANSILLNFSVNCASFSSDMIDVAKSVGANFAVRGLTKDAVRPITHRLDEGSLNHLLASTVNQPFGMRSYLSADTSAGPMTLNMMLKHQPGAENREYSAALRLMQQLSGAAQLNISNDAFLLAQLALKRVVRETESNPDIKHLEGQSRISITITNGVAQIGNLHFDLPSLTLL